MLCHDLNYSYSIWREKQELLLFWGILFIWVGDFILFFFLPFFLVLFWFFSSFHLYHSEYYMWFRIVTWLGCHPLQLRHFISLLIFASKHSPYPNLLQFLIYPISIWIQIDFLVDLPSLRKYSSIYCILVLALRDGKTNVR